MFIIFTVITQQMYVNSYTQTGVTHGVLINLLLFQNYVLFRKLFYYLVINTNEELPYSYTEILVVFPWQQ